MKNLIIVFVILFATLSCSKSDDSKFNVPRIVIKGTLSGSIHEKQDIECRKSIVAI